MTDPIAKGGRGHKAPYETTHVRIALGIKPVVERLSAVYRQKFFGNTNPDSNGATELIERVEAALSPVVPTVENYQQVCVRYLASLQLEEQAPEYKKAKQHIEAFIQELKMARLPLTPLNIISKACELLSRIYMGQLEEVALLFSELPDEQYQELVDTLKSLKSIIKVTSKQSNSGIRDENIPEVARHAYDIHQLIRYYLARKHFPQGGAAVHFDSPNAYGSLSLPTISE